MDKNDIKRSDNIMNRFVKAQEMDYGMALLEIKSGRKRSHWSWYVFPQVKGVGYSAISHYYEIKDIAEAKEYIAHPILYPRLIEITSLLLELDGNIEDIMENPDYLKLKSSMTLFYLVSGNKLFKKVLDKFYCGEMCEFTKKFVENL